MTGLTSKNVSRQWGLYASKTTVNRAEHVGSGVGS